MRKSIILFFLVVYGSLSAQTEKIKADKFNTIRIFGPFKVTLVKAATSRAEIEYRGINPDEVLIKNDDNTLQLKLRNRSFLDFTDNNRNRNRSYAIVTIYYTSLENIEAKAGAIIRSTELIEATKLTIVSKMGAEVQLQIKTQKLFLDSSMGSQVELTGIAETAEIKSKMGSTVNASQLQSQQVEVSSSMGSDVSVFAERELNASADFGGSISYKGNPEHKHTSTFLGAEVKAKRKY